MHIFIEKLQKSPSAGGSVSTHWEILAMYAPQWITRPTGIHYLRRTAATMRITRRHRH